MRKTTTIAVRMMMPMLMAAVLGAQGTSSGTAKPAAKPAAPPKTVTLVGCVTGTGAVGDPFTLQNPKEGIAYRLTGTNMRSYVGHQVQIAGGPDTRRLKIVGGLMPSANAAAQAGAIDPAKAAVAADPINTTGKSDQQLPEFRVRSVRSLSGSCE